MTVREQRLASTLISLADTLVSDFDLPDYLDELLSESTGILDAAAGGVLLANGDGELQLLASTDERTRVVELFELQRREGPCVEAFTTGRAVAEPDLGASRWPRLAEVARESGYGAVFAFPLRLRADVIGALNLFRNAPGGAEDADLRAAQTFADMATIGILQQRAVQEARQLAGQLQTALNSRVVIEQAKGILAERGGLDMGAAFDALRSFSRNHNRRLREVAAAVVSGELVPADLGHMVAPGRDGA